MTSVVTPCLTFGSWSGSASIISPLWLWRSMKPGATTMPVASITRPASGGASPGPTMRSLSPSTATLPAYPAAPVPSTIFPPLISRSAGRLTFRNSAS